ncbi:MAG: hypothetical protein LBD12_03725 [Clostridiales Family XIII bacterium]|jgi:hypothetical protein|nr:hypothetical protein [Clostridiales Family XIII bacterium]
MRDKDTGTLRVREITAKVSEGSDCSQKEATAYLKELLRLVARGLQDEAFCEDAAAALYALSFCDVKEEKQIDLIGGLGDLHKAHGKNGRIAEHFAVVCFNYNVTPGATQTVAAYNVTNLRGLEAAFPESTEIVECCSGALRAFHARSDSARYQKSVEELEALAERHPDNAVVMDDLAFARAHLKTLPESNNLFKKYYDWTKDRA